MPLRDPGNLNFDVTVRTGRVLGEHDHAFWNRGMLQTRQRISAVMEAKATGRLQNSSIFKFENTPFTIKDYYDLSQSKDFGPQVSRLAGGIVYSTMKGHFAKIP